MGMSAPYYSDESVTLYLGDSREMTEWEAADILVTDPPYGRRWRQGNLKGKSNSDGHGGIIGDGSTDVRDEILARWLPRSAMVFGDLTMAPPAGIVQTLIYRKAPNAGLRGAMAGFRRDVEAIYLAGRWPSGLGGQSSIIATRAPSQGNPSSPVGRFKHPHAKPTDVMELLVACCPPGVIADPFAGSGSTLVAAKALGRTAIGVEIVEEYCETAAKRLSQDVLDLGPMKGVGLEPDDRPALFDLTNGK